MAAVIEPDRQHRVQGALDRSAICVSALCLVQCLLLPLVIVVAPIASLGFLASHAFHLMLLGFILPVSLVAFGLGYRLHRNATTLVFGAVGLTILVVAYVLEHNGLGHLPAALITSTGGLFLIAGHLINIRARRRACLPG